MYITRDVRYSLLAEVMKNLLTYHLVQLEAPCVCLVTYESACGRQLLDLLFCRVEELNSHLYLLQ